MGFFKNVDIWVGWAIMGEGREIISIVFVLFIESFPPSHFNPPLLFSLPVSAGCSWIMTAK